MKNLYSLLVPVICSSFSLSKGIRIPKSVKLLHVEYEIQENFASGIRNLGLLESEIQPKESEIPLTTKIQYPSSTLIKTGI